MLLHDALVHAEGHEHLDRLRHLLKLYHDAMPAMVRRVPELKPIFRFAAERSRQTSKSSNASASSRTATPFSADNPRMKSVRTSNPAISFTAPPASLKRIMRLIRLATVGRDDPPRQNSKDLDLSP